MSDMAQLMERIDAALQNLDDDAAFRQAVADVIALPGADVIGLANDLAVSRTTIGRWANGRAIPHPAMRRPVYCSGR